MSYRDFKDRWDIRGEGDAVVPIGLTFIPATDYLAINYIPKPEFTEDAYFEIIEPLQLPDGK